MNIFMANPTITVGLIAFLSAQIIKTVLYAIKQKSFNPERITGAGGMPSSHSSLVVSVALYLLRLEGVHSTSFALSILILGVVIYDALSVRYNAGLHGKELNRLRRVIDEMDDEISRLGGEDLKDEKLDEMSDRKEFKEFLGHKPIEVLAGALLGILIGMVFPVPKG
ncbi:MAG: divergent PAP2 family protein [Oscillospiraceae bacterium]|nr:divergent PAP2 family protein [Oscillospiraceae bacterium]